MRVSPAPPPSTSHRSVTQRIGRFLWQTTASQSITVLVTVLITTGMAFLWGRVTAGSPAPSVDVQLAELRETAVRQHEVLFVQPASLHGGLSYVVVSEQPIQESSFFGRSDDIRIYDVNHGRLKKVFDFRPSPDGREPWRYRLDGVQDLENTGTQEVIGGFWLLIDSGGTRAFVPTVVSWDDATKRYVIEPLLPESPLEQSGPEHVHEFLGVGGPAWWRLETEGVTIRDPRSGVAFHGYGGVEYIVRTVSSFRAPSGTGLIVVAVIDAIHADEPVEQLSGWVINPTLPKVTVSGCPALHPTLGFVYGDLRGEIAKRYGDSGQQC